MRKSNFIINSTLSLTTKAADHAVHRAFWPTTEITLILRSF